MQHWEQLDTHACPCQGEGWAEIDSGIYSECIIHYNGQLPPDVKNLLLDEPNKLAEEERKSCLQFQIKNIRNDIQELQIKLKEYQSKLVNLELELTLKTPTVRAMPAVIPPLSSNVSLHECVAVELDWNILDEN